MTHPSGKGEAGLPPARAVLHRGVGVWRREGFPCVGVYSITAVRVMPTLPCLLSVCPLMRITALERKQIISGWSRDNISYLFQIVPYSGWGAAGHAPPMTRGAR